MCKVSDTGWEADDKGWGCWYWAVIVSLCVICEQMILSNVSIENRDLCGWDQTWATYHSGWLAAWYLLDGSVDWPWSIGWPCEQEHRAVAAFLATAYKSIRGGNQFWPGWWASEARVAGSACGRIRHVHLTCLNPWLISFMQLLSPVSIIQPVSIAFWDPRRKIVVVAE